MGHIYKRHVEGQRLYLREVNLSDVNENYWKWLNDPEVNQYLETRYIPQSLENIKSYVESMDGNPDEVFWAMCLKENDQHIGNIKLGPLNWYHRRADISLFIGEKEQWGKGLASEVISMVTNFAFNSLGLNKVSAGCYDVNIGSAKAFQKAGFEIEAELKNNLFFNGKFVSELCLALTQECWCKAHTDGE